MDDTSTLLRFFAEMVHPAVLGDTNEASALVDTVNQLLQPDGWDLYRSSLISGRPVWRARRYSPLPIAPQQLRDAIAEAIAELKAYEIPAFCEGALGLANQEAHGDETQCPASAWRSHALIKALYCLDLGASEEVGVLVRMSLSSGGSFSTAGRACALCDTHRWLPAWRSCHRRKR